MHTLILQDVCKVQNQLDSLSKEVVEIKETVKEIKELVTKMISIHGSPQRNDSSIPLTPPPLPPPLDMDNYGLSPSTLQVLFVCLCACISVYICKHL